MKPQPAVFVPDLFEAARLGEVAKMRIMLLKKRGKKHLTMRVKDGALTLSVPANSKREEILNFIAEHTDWVLKIANSQREKTDATRNFLESGKMEYFGEVVELADLMALAESARAKNKKSAACGVERIDSKKILSVESKRICADAAVGNFTRTAPKHLCAFLKSRLRDFIIERTEFYAAQMGVEFASISINTAATRFGSCSYKNSLNFSLMLVFLSADLIDYVVVHELAHIIHKDHSPRFWGLVGRHFPAYLSARASLKSKSTHLKLLLRFVSTR